MIKRHHFSLQPSSSVFYFSKTFCISTPLLFPSLSTQAWFHFLPVKSLPSWVSLANRDSITHHVTVLQISSLSSLGFRNTLNFPPLNPLFNMSFSFPLSVSFLECLLDSSHSPLIISCTLLAYFWQLIFLSKIPSHLLCSFFSQGDYTKLACMQVKKQQLEPDMEQQTGSKLGKEYIKAVYCHPDYLTYVQSTSCEMPGWMKYKLELRFPGEISITSDMQMTPSYGRKWKGTKGLLDEGERGEWKAGLKLNIQKTKIMASGLITSWRIDGETMKTVTDFIFLGSKITADGHMKLKDTCSLKEKQWQT